MDTALDINPLKTRLGMQLPTTQTRPDHAVSHEVFGMPNKPTCRRRRFLLRAPRTAVWVRR